MFSYGIGGVIIGSILCIVGGVTMAFGANELVSEAIGTNYIRDWMGESLYDSLYVGLNIASSVGTVAGRFGMQVASTSYGNAVSQARPYSKIISNNTYHYDGKGLPYWSLHKIGKVNQHWHTCLGRDNEHIWFYLEFLIKFIFRKW